MSHEALLDLPLTQITFAVLDVETTGNIPGLDRVVELAVVIQKGREEPVVAIDTLVNPLREMGATEIHGLTDEDVREAPTFSQIRGLLASQLAGRIVVAHNAEFDLAVLRSELGPSFGPNPLPHVCTQELHHHLRPGARRSLPQSCSTFEVEMGTPHCARDDAEATARILARQLHVARVEKKLRLLRDLKESGCGRFAASLGFPTLTQPVSMPDKTVQRPRDATTKRRSNSPLARYLDEIKGALADLHIDEEELRSIKAMREELDLDASVVRALHAGLYMAMLKRYTEEGILDETERSNLKRLHEALRTLGWAPGD